MSDDYKAAFRAAQAQRGLAAKPSKQQLKALKAKQGAAGAAAAAKQVQSQTAPAAKPASAAGLPVDFFDSKGSGPPQQPVAASKHPPQKRSQQQSPVVQQLSGAKRPAPAPAAGSAGSRGLSGNDDAAVPKGFFDSKEADDLARGIKQPTKQDKEAAFAEFAASMDDQLKQQAVEEDEEAVEAALEREEREAFEQRQRLERTTQLKALKNSRAATDHLPIDETIAAAVPAASKKRRVVDVLQEVLGGASEGETDEDGEDEDALLDWRAKTV